MATKKKTTKKTAKAKPYPDPKDVYEVGNSCYLCDSAKGTNSTCPHCINYKHIDEKLTAKEKLAKARKYTLEELTSKMRPEHNIPDLFEDSSDLEEARDQLLDAYSIYAEDASKELLGNKCPWYERTIKIPSELQDKVLRALLTEEDLEHLKLESVCENCVDTTESECIDCGRKFKCEPLVDDQCHSCFNHDVNDKDLTGKTPLELVPIEFLEYPATPLQIGLLKGYTGGSWKAHMPRSKWIAAAIRHLIAYEKGENGDRGIYTEYHPQTGEPISVTGEHIKAAIFNLCRVQWSIEHGKEDEDDRI